MADGSQVYINSGDVKSFQNDVNKLADTLQKYKDTLERNLSALSNDWKDEKFKQFESSFRSKKDQIQSISEFMKQWSNSYLKETYDQMVDYEKTSMR